MSVMATAASFEICFWSSLTQATPPYDPPTTTMCFMGEKVVSYVVCEKVVVIVNVQLRLCDVGVVRDTEEKRKKIRIESETKYQNIEISTFLTPSAMTEAIRIRCWLCISLIKLTEEQYSMSGCVARRQRFHFPFTSPPYQPVPSGRRHFFVGRKLPRFRHT